MKNYIKPNAEIKNFVSESVIAASGVSTNPLVAKASKTFSNADANVSWKSQVK